MIIYILAVYSCVSITMPFSTDLASKTCTWDNHGFYTSAEKCDVAAPQDGAPVLSDMMDNRTVERHRCNGVGVN